MAEERTKVESTHPDKYLSQLELEYILDKVRGKTLNIGCGGGFETEATRKKTGSSIGLDFSEEMIKIARKKYPKNKFIEGDVLNLPFEDASFESVTTRRTLINLLSWEEQKKALEEIKRVLKPKGKMILVEGSKEGYNRLNILRESMELERIKVAPFNFPISEKNLRNALGSIAINRLNTYYFLTRVYYPSFEGEVRYNTKFHKQAYELQKKVDVEIDCSAHILITKEMSK